MPPRRRLAPVPDVPLRAVGLIRVSTERDEMVSPEIQRTAIEDHCARRGYAVTRWVEGIDESGSRRRSPWWRKLDESVGLVESGDADVLVVWRFSRTARQRLRWAIAVDRVEVAGGLLESATEPLDTSTASGRLARGMLGEMAAYEAEVIGQTWREVHARRTARGLPANAKPRWGYQVVDGVHQPDPKTGPVLASLYRRYIAGESIYALVAWLNAEGFRTVEGYSKRGPGPWTQMTLRRMLDVGFGAGFITVHGTPQRGVHEPVIDEPTWRAYVAARAGRRTLRRSERSQYLLSGMVRCMHVVPAGGRCNSPMGGGQFGHARTPKYRCIAAAAERRHDGGYVTMTVVEDAVVGWLREQASRLDAASDKVRVRSPGRSRQRREADEIAREIVDLDRQLANLTRQLGRELIPEKAYRAAAAEISMEKASREREHAQVLAAAQRSDVPAIAAQLLADWDALLVEERRAILRRLILRVEVVPGRPRSDVRIIPG